MVVALLPLLFLTPVVSQGASEEAHECPHVSATCAFMWVDQKDETISEMFHSGMMKHTAL